MIKKRSIILILILFTALLVYSFSFNNEFIWDDVHLVVNNETIKSLANLGAIFNTHLFQQAGGSNFYRPIQTLTLAIDYATWKLNPFGYRLTNIIFHLLNIILIYFAVSRLFNDPKIGLLTSLIFALHPVNTEAVTYIAGRADPVSCFFFLSAFLFYVRFRKSHAITPFIFSILFFIFALLTKESVLIFPFILILYDAVILGHKSSGIKQIKAYVPYFTVLALYILYRLFFLGLPLGLMNHPMFKPYILTISKILNLYLGLLFFPIRLHMERQVPVIESVLDPQAIVALATVICIIWLTQIFYRKSKVLFFCAGFFFITLLPMSNILTLNAMMAEHWLYLPSIGVYAVIVFGFTKIVDFTKPFIQQKISAKAAIFIFIIFLGFFSIRTIYRNIEWGRPLEFYKNMLKHSPDSARGHSNIASVYMSAKDYNSAKEEFLRGKDLDPKSYFSYHGLGFVAFFENNKTEVINNWKKALEINPFYLPTREAMRQFLYKENKRFRRLLRATKEHPGNIMANYRLSGLYLKNGLYIEAIERLNKVLEVDPNYANAIFNTAWLYSKMGLYTKAIKEYEKVGALTPNDPEIYMNQGFCYARLNKRKEAEAMWQKALNMSR